jgi:hypothetical protein
MSKLAAQIWMCQNVGNYEECGGEVNRTRMAEDYADECDVYEEDGSIPDWVFEVSHEIAEDFEKKESRSTWRRRHTVYD